MKLISSSGLTIYQLHNLGKLMSQYNKSSVLFYKLEVKMFSLTYLRGLVRLQGQCGNEKAL
jgi:hypothetical protein